MSDDQRSHLFLNKTRPTIRRLAKNLGIDGGNKKGRNVKTKGT
jgi:hypothetical protein